MQKASKNFFASRFVFSLFAGLMLMAGLSAALLTSASSQDIRQQASVGTIPYGSGNPAAQQKGVCNGVNGSQSCKDHKPGDNCVTPKGLSKCDSSCFCPVPTPKMCEGKFLNTQTTCKNGIEYKCVTDSAPVDSQNIPMQEMPGTFCGSICYEPTRFTLTGKRTTDGSDICTGKPWSIACYRLGQNTRAQDPAASVPNGATTCESSFVGGVETWRVNKCTITAPGSTPVFVQEIKPTQYCGKSCPPGSERLGGTSIGGTIICRGPINMNL